MAGKQEYLVQKIGGRKDPLVVRDIAAAGELAEAGYRIHNATS